MNIYEEITSRIIERIDKGEIVWQKPWVSNFACKSGATGNPYSLLNQLLLGARPGYYYTFKQVKERGGSVKKGSKGARIFFYTTYQTKADKEKIDSLEAEEGGSWITTPRRCLKCYTVFHHDDVTGIELPPEADFVPVEHSFDVNAECVINNSVGREKIAMEVKPCDCPFYSPSTDSVTLVAPELYQDIAEYYSSAFHELAHSTMTANRCNRPSATGDKKKYAREELVAEIASAMLCHATNVDTEKAFNNSVAYLQYWRGKLTEDPAAIVWAASRAEKAAKYILG